MHCHMTHHVMNQMGHGIPNMIGVKPGKLDAKVQSPVARLHEHGRNRHGRHGARWAWPCPKNSIPMVGGRGKYDTITMGGMFTILKVRDELTSYADPGWYEAPVGHPRRASACGGSRARRHRS